MKPNCMKCKHFFITFNQMTPRGCRIYKIESKDLPAQIVKRANNGADCLGFELKPQKNENRKKDLNDPGLW